MLKIVSVFAAAGVVLLAGGAVQAAPTSYTFHQTAMSGTLGGVPISGTYDWTVVADTSTLAVATVVGSAGKCVTGTSSTFSYNGGASIAVTTPLYVCIADTRIYGGFYKTPGDVNAVSTLTTGTLTGASLSTPGTYAIPAGSIHNHGSTGGSVVTSAGALVITQPENNNPAGSTFTVGSIAAPVPTLSEWAMILFGTILAAGAALYIQRRRTTV